MTQQTINDIARECYNIAKEHGFWDLPPEVRMNSQVIRELVISQKLMLIDSETAEALECLRAGEIWTKLREGDSKPEGMASELADVVIRLFDLCWWLGVNIGEEIDKKMQYNRSRPYKHGKAF